MRFFVGMHQTTDAGKAGPAFVSVNRLKKRYTMAEVGDWIMDSGAFTTIAKHGGFPHRPSAYAAEIKRWSKVGNLLAAISQDYMCEPHMLAITGKTITEHQAMTIERYDALLREDTGGIYIMPVLQGYAPADYARHVTQYGSRLDYGAWVGVGSVCKRNGDPSAIYAVLSAIKSVRPDLRLHGFGLKLTSLKHSRITALLHSADSMAWSYGARMNGRSPNDWREAADFTDRVNTILEETEVVGRPSKFDPEFVRDVSTEWLTDLWSRHPEDLARNLARDPLYVTKLRVKAAQYDSTVRTWLEALDYVSKDHPNYLTELHFRQWCLSLEPPYPPERFARNPGMEADVRAEFKLSRDNPPEKSGPWLGAIARVKTGTRTTLVLPTQEDNDDGYV